MSLISCIQLNLTILPIALQDISGGTGNTSGLSSIITTSTVHITECS